jgi:hypothetical protein
MVAQLFGEPAAKALNFFAGLRLKADGNQLTRFWVGRFYHRSLAGIGCK